MSLHVYIDNPASILDEKAFRLYKERSKGVTIKKRSMCQSRVEYSEVVKTIWDVVCTRLLNNTAGVYLDGIGYLAHWMTPHRVRMAGFTTRTEGSSRSIEVEEHLNHQTNGRFYFTGLFHVKQRSLFRGWDLERGIHTDFSRARWKKLKTGHVYKLNYIELKKLFYREKYDY